MTVAYISSSDPADASVPRGRTRLDRSAIPLDGERRGQSPCQRRHEVRGSWGRRHKSLPLPGKATRGNAVACARPRRTLACDPCPVDAKRSNAGEKAIQGTGTVRVGHQHNSMMGWRPRLSIGRRWGKIQPLSATKSGRAAPARKLGR
jgi:hypothetical protein